MASKSNPFQFGAANDFSPEKVLEYYVEDFNYSRFINSRRNIFILGERGSGKTMALLYHTLDTQRCKAKRDGEECSWIRLVYIFPATPP